MIDKRTNNTNKRQRPREFVLFFFFSFSPGKHYVVCDNQINLVSTTGTLYINKSIKLPLLTIAVIYSDTQ